MHAFTMIFYIGGLRCFAYAVYSSKALESRIVNTTITANLLLNNE